MQITVDLPDDLAQQMIPAGQNPARAVLENMAVEAFRSQRSQSTSPSETGIPLSRRQPRRTSRYG